MNKENKNEIFNGNNRHSIPAEASGNTGGFWTITSYSCSCKCRKYILHCVLVIVGVKGPFELP